MCRRNPTDSRWPLLTGRPRLVGPMDGNSNLFARKELWSNSHFYKGTLILPIIYTSCEQITPFQVGQEERHSQKLSPWDIWWTSYREQLSEGIQTRHHEQYSTYLYRSLALKWPALISIFKHTGPDSGAWPWRRAAANLAGSQYCTRGSWRPPVERWKWSATTTTKIS